MATGNQGRIFISYRRQESSWPARQLYEVLAARFGPESVFKDVDDIEPGDDFVERITEAVASCDVLLALIGNQWISMTDDQGRRRLDNPEDFVRLELQAALSRGVRVVPILVDGAPMPRPEELPPDLVALTRRQAVEISAVGFNTDRLMVTLAATLGTREQPAPLLPEPRAEDVPAQAGPVAPVVHPVPTAVVTPGPTPQRRWLVPVAAGAALVVIGAALVVLHPWTGTTQTGANRPSVSASGAPSGGATPSVTSSPGVTLTGPLILAHRGGLEEHQFETEQAMEAAATAGFSVETDVRYTSDGVAVLVHDEEATKGLDCGGRSIQVSRTSWADLKKFCHSKPTAKDPAQYDVPKLDATLEGIAAASEQVQVFLEVKTALSDQRRREFLATPAKYGLTDRTVFTSAKLGWLDDIRKADRTTRRMLFVSKKAVPAGSLADHGLYMVAVEQGVASRQYIADLQAIGVKVAVWNLNDPKQWATFISYGPDVLMTDYPARLKEWLASR